MVKSIIKAIGRTIKKKTSVDKKPPVKANAESKKENKKTHAEKSAPKSAPPLLGGEAEEWSPGSGGSKSEKKTTQRKNTSRRSDNESSQGGPRKKRPARKKTTDNSTARTATKKTTAKNNSEEPAKRTQRPRRRPAAKKTESGSNNEQATEKNSESQNTKRKTSGNRRPRQNQDGEKQGPQNAVKPQQENAEGQAPRKRRRRRKPASQRQEGAENNTGSERQENAEKQKAPTQPRKEKPQKPAEPWDRSSFVVEVVEDKTRFLDIDMPEELMHSVADMNFQYCTPIQAALIPPGIDGKDCTGRAQTGTGKTAAFLLTVFSRMLREAPQNEGRNNTPRALVLAPTRELAKQIEEEAVRLSKHTNLRTVALYGGVPYDKQRRVLEGGPIDLVVATPGRLIDFIRQRQMHLGHLDTLVIDEADRMLDMGFIPDVRRIIHHCPNRDKRQTLLFSATLTPDVVRLAGQWLKDAVTVEIEPDQVAVDTVEQRIYIVTDAEKYTLLYNILKREQPESAIIFANRRDTVQNLTDHLNAHGFKAAQISGALPQNKRERTLNSFKAGELPILVATDVAGRGLHIDGISHVINYNIPTEPDDYVHRIGRTGRAGKSGVSVSFAAESDSFYIPDIEKYIGRDLPCQVPDEEWFEEPPKVNIPRRPRSNDRNRSGGNRRPPRRR